jgi:V8-like Glu-specific endopeptidase
MSASEGKMKRFGNVAATALAVIMVLTLSAAHGDDSIVSNTSAPSSALATSTGGPTEAQMATARSRLPIITDPDLLPPATRDMVVQAESGIVAHAYGSSSAHPFTTKRAGAAITRSPSWLRKGPWKSTGKLWMRFGEDWFVCTASIIEKGLLVTAAHCVHNYGAEAAGFADEVYFEPIRHDRRKPRGKWKALEWWIPTVYFNGTDVCTTPGVVCENDLAIVVLQKKGRSYVSKRSGMYDYGENNYSYVSFLGRTAAQITQLGYPVALDGGYRMIRTDSLGLQDTPNNVVIGSDQTGGSSGGPWLVNFGYDYDSFNPLPLDAQMRVMAVTSWGYTSNAIKVQGSSRFSTNTNFIGTTNIRAMLQGVCGIWPDHCDSTH